jgi:hypothetical protein
MSGKGGSRMSIELTAAELDALDDTHDSCGIRHSERGVTYYCTRSPLHDGEHIAAGFVDILCKWVSSLDMDAG